MLINHKIKSIRTFIRSMPSIPSLTLSAQGFCLEYLYLNKLMIA